MCGVVFVASCSCTVLYIAKPTLCIEQECTAYLYNNIRAGRERKSYHIYGFNKRNLKDKP